MRFISRFSLNCCYSLRDLKPQWLLQGLFLVIMFVLIQSRQRNISMWFTVWDQSQIPALNTWNSSSSYLQQTGQDQSRNKKEGPTFLEGSRDLSLRSVSLNNACNGTHTVLIHVPVLGLIPSFFVWLFDYLFVCFGGVFDCLVLIGWGFFSLQPFAFLLMFQAFVSIWQAGSGFRTGFHAKAFLYLMKTSE